MAHTDVMVLGAGIVGTSIALHLAKRGFSVALVDRGGAGEGTSYGNTGIIEGNTIFPQVFPRAGRSSCASRSSARRKPTIIWRSCRRSCRGSRRSAPPRSPARLLETAQLMRPLFAARSPSTRRSAPRPAPSAMCAATAGSSFTAATAHSPAQARELELAASLGIANVPLDSDAARALEPSLAPVFRHAVHWTGAVSVSNPLALTRAYAARFAALGGITLHGDARTLHRAAPHWRVDTAAGPLDAGDVVIALGPWMPDVLEPLGIKLPLAVKRGYHRHFRAARQCRA